MPLDNDECATVRLGDLQRLRVIFRIAVLGKDALVRIEGDFPADLNVYDFEFKPGWKIEFKKDDKGKIAGAFWIGRIEPYEFVEFGMLAINPKEGSPNMLWKFYQFYEDGFKEEFTAPPDAKMPLRPMPEVTLTPEPSSPKS